MGLATTANLIEHGLTPIIFESGKEVGAAIRQWGHIRLLSPVAAQYQPRIQPAATTHRLERAPSYRSAVWCRTGGWVPDSTGRDEWPFLVRVKLADGTVTDHHVRSVFDASGTWAQPNPLGQAGLAAPGSVGPSEQLMPPACTAVEISTDYRPEANSATGCANSSWKGTRTALQSPSRPSPWTWAKA